MNQSDYEERFSEEIPEPRQHGVKSRLWAIFGLLCIGAVVGGVVMGFVLKWPN